MRIRVVNAGSSSLKFRALDPDGAIVASEDLPATRDQADDQSSVALSRTYLRSMWWVAPSQGGAKLSQPTVVDSDVKDWRRDLAVFDPLHQHRLLDVRGDALRRVHPPPRLAMPSKLGRRFHRENLGLLFVSQIYLTSASGSGAKLLG